MAFGLRRIRTYLIARSADKQYRFFSSQQHANNPALPTPIIIMRKE